MKSNVRLLLGKQTDASKRIAKRMSFLNIVSYCVSYLGRRMNFDLERGNPYEKSIYQLIIVYSTHIKPGGTICGCKS